RAASQRARNETRTRDPFLTMEVLYQLSYPGRQRRPLRGSQGAILEGLRGVGAGGDQTRLRAGPAVLEGRGELRLRRSRGHHTQGFLPVLRRDRYGCQRLRRVPLVCLLGRRAFLRGQTTTVLLSTASVTTTGMTRT